MATTAALYVLLALTLTVEVEDRAKVSPKMLAKAQEWVQKVYDDIGVRIVWLTPDSPVESRLRLRIVLIRQIEEKHFLAGVSTMGTALGSGGMGARRAYVSPMAVIKATRAGSELPESFVLGCVIAHEIGHLLLPRDPDPHSEAGIMRPAFRINEFDRSDSGGIRFTAEQARYIQLLVQEQTQGH